MACVPDRTFLLLFLLSQVSASLQRSSGVAQIHRLKVWPRKCITQATECEILCPSKYRVEVSGSDVRFTSLDYSSNGGSCNCFEATASIGKWGDRLAGTFPGHPGNDFEMTVDRSNKGRPTILARYHTICQATYKVTDGMFLSIKSHEDEL